LRFPGNPVPFYKNVIFLPFHSPFTPEEMWLGLAVKPETVSPKVGFLHRASKKAMPGEI
jgi:hypothetical protein